MNIKTRSCLRLWARTPAIWALVGLAPLWAACGDSTGPVSTLWEGNLTPVPPSQVSGQVAAVTQFGRTEVSIQIRFADPGSTHNWRVESGNCQADGTIQGGLAVYPPLTAGEGGSNSQTAILSSQFKSGSQLAVKVFNSVEGGSGEMVSCGELVET